MMSLFFRSLLIHGGLSIIILLGLDISYRRSRILKKYAVTRSLGRIIEEYQKLLAKDWIIESTPLPVAFRPTLKVMLLMTTCLLFILFIIVFDQEPGGTPWVTILVGIFVFCLIGFLQNLWMTFTVVITETSVLLDPFVSLFGIRPTLEYSYASIEKMEIVLTAQKSTYGRFGVEFRINIETNGRRYSQILNNLETPSVRAIVSLLASRLGAKLTVTYQGF